MRPTKRQRIESPPCWMDVASFELVLTGSKAGTVSLLNTPVADSVACNIFLDRFCKELLLPFQINLSRASSTTVPANERLHLEDARLQKRNFRRRIAVGVNVASKILESEAAAVRSAESNNDRDFRHNSPLLVVLVNAENSEDALCLAHIPALCHSCGVPLLLLPEIPGEKTTTRLGKALGIRTASVLTFMAPGHNSSTIMDHRIDSFIKYSKTLIPSK
ncbi:hypothetical protein ACA910_000757 [Epithemia clementina (nom. ined.)]